jgi:DNA-binding response OmpR family regulator
VIEPDPAVRDGVSELLRDAGYRPVAVQSTTEAIRVAAARGPGIDLLVTGLGESRAAAIAGTVGAARSVSVAKPYSPQRLLAAVRDALDVPQLDAAGRPFG